MMSSQSLDSLYAEDDLFNCCICMNHFDDDLRKPKMLPCHHTFCKFCIHSMIYSTGSGPSSKTVCPLCSAPFSISNVDALQSNVYLDKFKDLMKYRSSSSRSGTGGLSSEETSFSYECRKHGNTLMFFWCKSCSLPVCTHCTAIDHVTANGHIVLDIGIATQMMQREATDSIEGLFQKIKQIQSKKVEAQNLRNPALANTIAALNQGFGAASKSVSCNINDNLLDPGKQFTRIKNADVFQEDAVSLSRLNKNVRELGDYLSTIETFLNQKLLECRLLSKSSILTCVIRSEIKFDYGRIYCPRCGDFCNIPKKISHNEGSPGGEGGAIEHSCLKCKINILQFH